MEFAAGRTRRIVLKYKQHALMGAERPSEPVSHAMFEGSLAISSSIPRSCIARRILAIHSQYSAWVKGRCFPDNTTRSACRFIGDDHAPAVEENQFVHHVYGEAKSGVPAVFGKCATYGAQRTDPLRVVCDTGPLFKLTV